MLINIHQLFANKHFFTVLVPIILSLPAKNRLPLPNRLAARLQINIGPCTWIIDRKCPDSDIKFYLYTRRNRKDRQHIYVDDSLEQSSLFDSYFNPNHPTKIIIHGYNSDMFLSPLIQMKEGMFIFLIVHTINKKSKKYVTNKLFHDW